MDVGFYVSELLELHGNITVPGLGRLVRARIDGYFNEAEQTFYPPRYEVRFEPDLAEDDDTLINYIADKKNISVASAKYFIEKHVINLKQEALTGEVMMGNTGVFYIENNELTFKPDSLQGDKAFYGLSSVKANKVITQPVAEIVSEPGSAPSPEALESPNIEPVIEQDNVIYEDEPTSRGARNWIIIFAVIIGLALAVFGLQRYNPAAFNKLLGREVKPVAAPKQVVVVDTTKTDTAVKSTDSTKVDTLTAKNKSINNRTIIPAVTGTGAPGSTRVELIIEAFKSLQKANAALERYKAKGVNAYIVPDAPGKRIMLSAGAYPTRDSAKVAMNALITAKKIYKDSYPLEIKQK